MRCMVLQLRLGGGYVWCVCVCGVYVCMVCGWMGGVYVWVGGWCVCVGGVYVWVLCGCICVVCGYVGGVVAVGHGRGMGGEVKLW